MALSDTIDSLGSRYQVSRRETVVEIVAVVDPSNRTITTKAKLELDDVVDVGTPRWKIISVVAQGLPGDVFYVCKAVDSQP